MAINQGEPPRKGRYVHQRWTAFALFLVFWVPMAAILYEYILGYLPHWPMIAFLAAIAFVVSWPFAFLADMILPTRADSDGMVSYNGWGIRRKVAWDRITGAKVMNFMPGLKYLAVLDGTNYFNRILIPTFITNKSELYDDVVEFAGVDHPLAAALRRHGFSAPVP